MITENETRTGRVVAGVALFLLLASPTAAEKRKEKEKEKGKKVPGTVLRYYIDARRLEVGKLSFLKPEPNGCPHQ